MTDSKRCPVCGALLSPNRFSGLCPACTWGGLFDSDEEDAAVPGGRSSGSLMRVAGHEVIEEIARGGMGIVYRARQLDPSRAVALKMLLPHQLASAGMAERFRLEVRALSELEHPAILPVYQTGEQDGLPFFTMKLATGGTLAQRRAQYAGHWRAISELVAGLADAVQFAHERGVLHRDLKPGNILFDDQNRAYVSDFGLAKLLTDDSELTRSMDFLGTPHYVAPEVASLSARSATTASDIYSLGAMLYELLAGRPPFEAEGVPALLRKIAEEEPVIRSKLQTPNSKLERVPRDLEVICLKCLAKEPARRYAAARDLAADLRRWLEGKPIAARPVSSAERAWKWVQHNPALAALAGALIVSLLGGGFTLWRSYRNVRAALGTTRQAQSEAQGNLRDALLAQAQALGAAQGVGQRWQALEALARAARIRPSLELRNEAAAALARPDLREAIRFPALIGDSGSSAVFTSDLDRYITPELSGGFALHATRDQKVLAAFPGPQNRPAKWFVLSPHDRLAAVLQADYSMEIWALDEKEPRVRWQGTIQQPPVCEFHPDGESLAAFVPGEGLFLRGSNGATRPLLQFTNNRPIYLRFDPKGERLALVRDPGGVEVLRCTGTPALLWSQPVSRAVPWLAWSPDGRKLVAGADDGRGIRVFSAGDGQTEIVYSRHSLYPRQFEFDPSGRFIASLGEDWRMRLWDARTAQDLVTTVGRHRVMRFSKDGHRLATAPTDRDLALLELAPDIVFREFSATPAGSQTDARGLACSKDGHWLVMSSPQLRLFDSRRGAEAAILNLRPAPAQHAFFDASATSVCYSSFGKGTFRRPFLCSSNEPGGQLQVHWGDEEMVAQHPNAIVWQTVQAGQTWVSRGSTGVELWPGRDRSRARLIEARGRLEGVTVSQNARWTAVADPVRHQVAIWDFDTRAVITNLSVRGPDRVWFSPDSQWLVASMETGYATWVTATWRPGPTWEARLDSGDPGEVSFSGDSRLMAVRQERQVFRLLSFPGCQEIVTLKPPLVVPIRSACLSEDGSRLWLLAIGCRLFEWNLAELRTELARLGLNWD